MAQLIIIEGRDGSRFDLHGNLLREDNGILSRDRMAIVTDEEGGLAYCDVTTVAQYNLSLLELEAWPLLSPYDNQPLMLSVQDYVRHYYDSNRSRILVLDPLRTSKIKELLLSPPFTYGQVWKALVEEREEGGREAFSSLEGLPFDKLEVAVPVGYTLKLKWSHQPLTAAALTSIVQWCVTYTNERSPRLQGLMTTWLNSLELNSLGVEDLLAELENDRPALEALTPHVMHYLREHSPATGLRLAEKFLRRLEDFKLSLSLEDARLCYNHSLLMPAKAKHVKEIARRALKSFSETK